MIQRIVDHVGLEKWNSIIMLACQLSDCEYVPFNPENSACRVAPSEVLCGFFPYDHFTSTIKVETAATIEGSHMSQFEENSDATAFVPFSSLQSSLNSVESCPSFATTDTYYADTADQAASFVSFDEDTLIVDECAEALTLLPPFPLVFDDTHYREHGVDATCSCCLTPEADK
jgi:hypothetical protein